MFKVPEKYRILHGEYQSTSANGNNGLFVIPAKKNKPMRIVASDGEGWEHASVSFRHRCPTWDEMCYTKGLFWSPEDLVVQFHPPASQYVNCHPFTLHLWRKCDTNDFADVPPTILIGPL